MNAAGTSYLPHPAPPATGNGFTVASEEPVYVYGDYNSGSADPFFPSAGANARRPFRCSYHRGFRYTTVQSASWKHCSHTQHRLDGCDSLAFPGTMNNRPGNTSYYRMAIAAGKSVPFPARVGWSRLGTDGGMHNFLRYLENRGATGPR